MAEQPEPGADPRIGRIHYTFEPPSLFQMIAGMIGSSIGWGLFMLWGEFLAKVTLTITALGSVAFLIGLWRYSEQVQFGSLGLRRHKWGGSTDLLYEEVGAVTHLGSEDQQKYSQLRVEALPDLGKSPIQFYRFEDETFPRAEQVLLSAVVDAMQQRLTRGQIVDWQPGVAFRRDGLEVASPDGTGAAKLVAYRDIGKWEAGDKGTLTLRSLAGEPLVTSSLDGRNFFPCYELLGRLKDGAKT